MLDGVFLPRLCQVRIDHGGFEVCMAQITLNGAEVDTRFKQMRGIGMPEGMGADVSFGGYRRVVWLCEKRLGRCCGA
jgi:hypothetical protein